MSESVVHKLRDQLQACRRSAPPVFLKTGCDELDRLFPGSGVRLGSLVEWIGADIGKGVGTLALLVAKQLLVTATESTEPQKGVVLIDTKRQLWPVALAALGFDLSAVTIIQPTNPTDTLWACEQALRSPAVGLVWGQLDTLSPTAFRRLQLAAEQGGAIGFLVRPQAALNQPSWAETRLVVHPRPTRNHSLDFQIETADLPGKHAPNYVTVTTNASVETAKRFRPLSKVS